ncbi:hypothetical protein MPSEU_000989600 [Mayamaea pseudoterrestris]|nr:hypothetical protein MPSEU_000989600 [Mayamaea pseudoterrestris]
MTILRASSSAAFGAPPNTPPLSARTSPSLRSRASRMPSNLELSVTKMSNVDDCLGCNDSTCLTCSTAMYCSFVTPTKSRSTMEEMTTTVAGVSRMTPPFPYPAAMALRGNAKSPTLTATSLTSRQRRVTPTSTNNSKQNQVFFERRRPSDSMTIPAASSSTRMQQLNTLSQYAAWFCVLDCTVLPMLLVVVPFLSVSPAASHQLHVLTHEMALKFVLPLGVVTTLLNFYSSTTASNSSGASDAKLAAASTTTTLTKATVNRPSLSRRFLLPYLYTALAVTGLILIFLANNESALATVMSSIKGGLHNAAAETSHGHLHHAHHHHAHHHVHAHAHAHHAHAHVHGHAHDIPEWLHRVVNIFGCACLMTANYLTKQFQKQTNNGGDSNGGDSSGGGFFCASPSCKC